MKLSSGKRIGQSGQELATAVSFSFFLHGLFFLAAMLLYFTVTPRTYTPPFYSVQLIGQAVELGTQPQSPSSGTQPPAVDNPPKHSVKPARKPPVKARGKHSAQKLHTEKRSSLPDLDAPKAKTSVAEEAEPQAAPSSRAGGTATPGAGAEGVAVATQQQDFKFGWYLDRVRGKIGQNWNPPPDASDAKARVVFSINRSGWVGEVNLIGDQSIGTFGFKQAAVRAIRASNPFPPLPEEFSRQSLEFTVDLMAVE